MGSFANLPQPAKWGFGVAGAGGIFAAGLFLRSGIWIVLTILVLAAIIFGLYFLFCWWRRKHESALFAEGVKQQSSKSPVGISDANKLARLDSLRVKFEEGLLVYEAKGKSLYSLPWYVFVGTPGSGKTEAVRHCGVSFPPGMNEEMQGTGGTLNMHWWFTDRAVILDTAGRIMFEEVKPGESSEWKEFLKLLRKSRPHCPINGLFLTIPVDNLLKDTADQIARKAGRIAQQFDVIQRALDVRFPVYVLVTKCDLLLGFREFFEDITDPQLQHQIMGWSNPDPLDAPFRPDLVDQHLETVAQRLRRRRMALLRDPVAVNTENRRTSEVDALYALPQGITRTIAPRLRRYLETIFIAGEWSAKPLFLRGIYFTSSLREGTALDNELAEALGVTVDELPEGRAWERDRAFFLRDLFIEKAFREQGLVTRATNTRTMLQRRQALVFGCGFAALVALGFFSYLAMKDLSSKIGREKSDWNTAANDWQSDGVWHPIVLLSTNASSLYAYRGTDTVAGVELVDFHTRLKELAANPPKINWVFRPITWLTPSRALDRKNAQRVVFERSVVWPLVNATRARMWHAPAVPEDAAVDTALIEKEQQWQFNALSSLIRLESGIYSGPGTLGTTNEVQDYLGSWLSYVTETNQVASTNLTTVMAWTYSASGGGKDKWPPQSLTGGDTLTDNVAIKHGLETYFNNARRTQERLEKRVQKVELIRDHSKEYFRLETNLYALVMRNLSKDDGSDRKAVIDRMGQLKPQLDSELLDGEGLGLTKGEAFRIAAAYTNLLAEANRTSKEARDRIEGLLPVSGKVKLFADIQELLKAQQDRGLVASIRTSQGKEPGIAEIDGTMFGFDDKYDYQQRWDLYQRARNLLPKQPMGFVDLIGRQWKPLEDLREKMTQFDDVMKKSSGPFRKEALAICHFFAEQAERSLYDDSVRQYIAGVRKESNRVTRLPQDEITLDTLKKTSQLIAKLEKDVAPSVITRIPEQSRDSVTNNVTGLIQACVQCCNRVIGTQLLFPLTMRGSSALTLQECLLARDAVTNALNGLNSSTTREDVDDDVTKLRDRLSTFERVFGALFQSDDSPATCAVSLADTQDDTVKYYRQIDAYPAHNYRAYNSKPTDQGKKGLVTDARIDQPLTIDVYEYTDDKDPKVRHTFEDWGPIRLILANKDSVERDAGGKLWKVPYRFSDGGATRVLNLELSFSQSLPELAKWPVE